MSELNLEKGTWKFFFIDPGVLTPVMEDGIPMELINMKPNAEEMKCGVENANMRSHGFEFDIIAFSEKTVRAVTDSGKIGNQSIPLVIEGSAYVSTNGYAVVKGGGAIQEVFRAAIGTFHAEARELQISHDEFEMIIARMENVTGIRYDKMQHMTLKTASLSGEFPAGDVEGFENHKRSRVAVKGTISIPGESGTMIRSLTVTNSGTASVGLKAQDILSGEVSENLTDWLFSLMSVTSEN